VIDGVGGLGFTVTLIAAVGEGTTHPFGSSTETVYVPDAFTEIVCVLAPPVQLYPAPAFAESITLPPWQKVVDPLGVMFAVPNGNTVTLVIAEVAVHPNELLTVTQ
jgi:hypothetical protein